MFRLKFLIWIFLLTKPVFSENSSLCGVCNVQKLKNIENNDSTSILYGILRASIEYPRTGECNRQLHRMLDGIHRRELWAIKGVYFDVTVVKRLMGSYNSNPFHNKYSY